MANIVAILTHTQRGEEVIVEQESHTFNYEGGGPATLAGVQLHPVPGDYGILSAQQIYAAIRPPDDVHLPTTRLICLENTHNRGGGKLYPLDQIKAIRELAQKYQLKMHLDGARLFNASIASGIAPCEYGRYFDSLMFCFSKGLGAPIGSILVGSKAFIELAHRYRKMLGGGMRQSGILAAAALYALEHHVERLAEDHQNAQLLAQGIAGHRNLRLTPESVETNIVIFDTTPSGLTAAQLIQRLLDRGVLMIAFGEYLVRAVTHLDVSRQQIELATRALADCMK
jgi:threonine aldolase